MTTLSDPRLHRIMEGHFKKATREWDEWMIYAKNPDDVLRWYVLIRNLSYDDDGVWTGGMFLFEVIATSEFPTKPPTFRAKFKNGVYEVDVPCCISIGEYHQTDYKAVLGMSGFTRELANGMMNHQFLTKLGGINLLHTTDKEKKKYCVESIKHLSTDFKHIYDLLDESFADYSSRWDLTQCNNELRRHLAFGRTKFPMRDEGGARDESRDESNASAAPSAGLINTSASSSDTLTVKPAVEPTVTPAVTPVVTPAVTPTVTHVVEPTVTPNVADVITPAVEPTQVTTIVTKTD